MRHPAPAEVHLLSPNLQTWQRYDPSVKADLFSTALATTRGVYLIDPIPLEVEALTAVISGRPLAGIVLTNANHVRASDVYAGQFGVFVYGRQDPSNAVSGNTPVLKDPDQLSPDLKVVAIEGAAPGEIALHSNQEGGTVVIGDALINFGSYEFTFLPPKYCADAKLMRKSLRKLLNYEFNRMLFAHGTPIMTNARDRLAALLSQDR